MSQAAYTRDLLSETPICQVGRMWHNEQVAERSKEHASKACEVKASASSNLALSAFRVPGFVPEPFLFLMRTSVFGVIGQNVCPAV